MLEPGDSSIHPPPPPPEPGHPLPTRPQSPPLPLCLPHPGVLCCCHLPGQLQWLPQGPPTSQFSIRTSAKVIFLGHISGIIGIIPLIPARDSHLPRRLCSLTEAWPGNSYVVCAARLRPWSSPSFYCSKARLSQAREGCG